MLHLTRCCLCVTLLAVTTAFAQTSITQSDMTAESTFTAADHAKFDSHERLERNKIEVPAVQDEKENQRRRVLTRAIESLEKRLKEPAANARRSKTKMKRESMVSMVVSIQPLIRLGLQETDIVSALKMIDQLEEGAIISTKFHKETGLLFIRTGFDTISLVDDVLEQLDVTAQTNAEKTRQRRMSRSMER